VSGARPARPRREEPPGGSPWDDPLAEAPLAFVDLEMTGLRPDRDRVVEVCVERVVGGRVVDRLESLVRPEPPVTGNVHVHGIDADAVAAAPTFAALAPRIEALLEGAIVIAHAAAWDVAFLEAELARAGRPRAIGGYLDTLTLSRRAFVLPSHSLTALCEHFGIERLRAHRAGDDVAAMRRVFELATAELEAATPRELWNVRAGERRARPEIVAAATAAAERGATVRVRYRPAGRGAEDLLVVVVAVRTDLDPPRVLGYLLPSRSRRELRADRILAIEAASGDAGGAGGGPMPGGRLGDGA
jgi:DNA polymerase-3 subunit epsilon